MFTPGVANFDESDAIAKSQLATNWQPAAVAIPLISAMTGFEQFIIICINEEHKLKRSKNMSNDTINNVYDYAMKNGALGGKLIGAGGGGFLLFYSKTPNKLRQALSNKKLEEVRFKFDFEGVKRIF